MDRVLTCLVTSIALGVALCAPIRAENVSAKKMQIKDDADAGRQGVTFLSGDAGIDVADGYAGATTHGLSLHVFNAVNDVCLQITPTECELKGADADILKCRRANRSGRVLIKPGKVKAKFKGGIGYELDALTNQLPVTVVLRAGSAVDGAIYCAVCGDGGSDDVVKDGSDGEQVLVKACDVVACPFEPGACIPPIARLEDPVVLTGSELGAPLVGMAPSDLVAFRWVGGWEQIPVQVDERAIVNFNNVYDGSGAGCFTCGGGFTRLDYTDPGTFTGADPDSTLDADDEIVFMASDAGGPAGTANQPPGTNPGGRRVTVVESSPLFSAIGYVYLFERQDAALDPGAGQHYVNYQFQLVSGSYLSTYNINAGPNPENTTVSSSVYARHFSDRWVQDELHVFAGGATGVDILDRHKEEVLGCFRTEDTFSAGEGAFVVNRGGPVRALRSYVGANSGPRTQRQHIFYRGREENTTFLRVHSLPGVVHDFIDHAPAATGMMFYDGNNLAGLLIDGVTDTFATGTLEWQLVTGAQGSVTVVPRFVTDVPGFTATPTYEDDVTPSGTQCTGDTSAYGANGVQIAGTGGTMPNTDPNNPAPVYTFTATRSIYYDAPGLSVADAQLRRAWVLNPLLFGTDPWP